MSDDKLQQIKSIINDIHKTYWERIIKTLHSDLYQYINIITKKHNPINFMESLYIILNGPPEYCQYNVKPKFKYFNSGYSKYCGVKCRCYSEFNSKMVKIRVQSITPHERIRQNEKMRQTNRERYNKDYPTQMPEFQEKIQDTNMKNRGVPFVFQDKHVKEKIIQTNLKRYNVKNPSQLSEIQNKKAETNLIKCGYRYSLESPEVRNTVKQNMLKLYNVEYPTQSLEVKLKSIATCLRKYDVYNPSQQHFSKDTFLILNSKINFINFVTGKTIYDITELLQISDTTLRNYIKKYNAYDLIIKQNKSSYELKISKLLNILNIEYISNDMKIIKPLQFDFYIKEYKFAIEVGSSYFHSEFNGEKDTYYHFNKWQRCFDQNITLFQYFDNDILHNFHLVEYDIKQMCKLSNIIINDDELFLSELNDLNAESHFLNLYHLHGYDTNRNLVIGAYYNNQLIGISTWSIINDYAELVKFAINTVYSCQNLLSLMLNKFELITNFSGKLIAITDNRHSNGNIFQINGFTSESILNPVYTYLKNFNPVSDKLYQIENLAEIFNLDPNYVNSKTEWEIMQEQGYDRLWDAGKTKWVKII